MPAAPAIAGTESVARLVHRAAQALAGAHTAAQVLDARDKARAAYDDIKRHLRLQKAKKAHDEIIAAAHRAQADVLDIESAAKKRLADEYDAAQQRGEAGRSGRPRSDGNRTKATAEELGLSRKEIFYARRIRDSSAGDPGIVRRELDAMLALGVEPSRSRLHRRLGIDHSGATTRRGIDEGVRLSDGRDVRRVSWFEIPELKRRAARDLRLLTAVENHVANPEPDTRVGDAISAVALDFMCRQAGEEDA